MKHYNASIPNQITFYFFCLTSFKNTAYIWSWCAWACISNNFGMSWLLSAQFESKTGVSELSHCHKFHENRQLDGKERSRGWKWAQPVSDRHHKNDIVKALTLGTASMECYKWPRDRKSQYTKSYLNIYSEGYHNKSQKNVWPSRYSTPRSRQDS